MKDNSVIRKNMIWIQFVLFVLIPFKSFLYGDTYLDEQDECVKRETGLSIFDKHPHTQQRAEESSY